MSSLLCNNYLEDNILTLEGRVYRLVGNPIKGGSSYVYKAELLNDSINCFYMIKEFYPHELGVTRAYDGSVCFPAGKEDEIAAFKKRVERESEIARFLRHDSDTENNNPQVMMYSKPIEANNTLYTIVQTENGDMLSSLIGGGYFKDKGFEAICNCILQILEALQPIHDKEHLHLDIAPDNIHFSKTGTARVIDYNSAISNTEEYPEGMMFSYKEGYSANELVELGGHVITKPTDAKVSRATDLYSVVAIFFEMLKNRRVSEDDSGNPLMWHLNSDGGILKGASAVLVSKTNALIEKGIRSFQKKRFKTISELRDAIKELKNLKKDILLAHRLIKPNRHFVHRTSELEDIGEVLEAEGYVFLEGIGGIGKTELAKVYAERAYEARKYDIVQFLNYSRSLQETIAVSLDFDNFDETRAREYSNIYGDRAIEYTFKDKLKWLKQHGENGQRILIVVDNYSSPTADGERRAEKDNDNFMNFVSGKYDVVFTSRERHERKPSVVDIMPMSDEDLFSLFRKYYTFDYDELEISDEDVPTIHEIIKITKGHTMTIMLVASAMAKDDEISAVDMLEKLREGLKNVPGIKIGIDKQSLENAQLMQTAYGHVKTLFDLTEIRDNEKHRFIMTNMAIVPEKGLRKKDFFDWALRWRYKDDEDAYDGKNDLEELIRRQWIQQHHVSKSRMVSLHRLISEVVNDELRPDINKCVVLLMRLIEYTKGNKNETHVEWSSNLDILKLACKRIHDETQNGAALLMYCAGFAVSIADYKIALEFLEKARHIYENELGLEHPLISTFYNEIANIYSIQCDDQKALELYGKALVIREKESGLEHPGIATIVNNIASIYQTQGDYHKAFELHNKALAIRKKIFGLEHPDIATSYDGIAIVYRTQGDYQKALELHCNALAIREKVLGLEHQDIATSYNDIAVIYKIQGDYQKASELCDKALAIREKVFGLGHPATAMLYKNMAGIYKTQGDYQKALELYYKALTVFEKVYDSEYLGTATLYNSMAGIYKTQGDYQKAHELHDKALAICEKVLGLEHPDTAVCYSNIAIVYQNQGDYRKALELHSKTLAIFEEVLGLEHPDTAVCYSNIAIVYQNQGDYRKALELHSKTLAIFEEVLGLEHPDTAACYGIIAFIYYTQCDYQKALELMHKTLDIYEKRFGKEHPATIQTNEFIAIINTAIAKQKSRRFKWLEALKP